MRPRVLESHAETGDFFLSRAGVAWGYRSRLATEQERNSGSPRTVVEPDPVAAPYARELFERIASVLPEGGRLYLQTMVFGRNMIPVDEIDIEAPRDSDAWYLALMGRQFPGSFLPFGDEQIVRSAEPHLRLVSSESGRLDYIETIRQWRKRFAEPSLRKTLMKVRLIPRWLTSADFRLAFTSGVSANSVCFERELLDHYRLTFERVG